MTVSGAIGLSAVIGPGTAGQATRGPEASRFAAALVLLGAAGSAIRGQHATAESAEAQAHRSASPASATASSQAFAGLVPWARTRRRGIASAGERGRGPSQPPRNRNQGTSHE